jgi:hypothetical protein
VQEAAGNFETVRISSNGTASAQSWYEINSSRELGAMGVKKQDGCRSLKSSL